MDIYCYIKTLCYVMLHSTDYPQCLVTTGLVKCGKGVVTWFSASANHMHSARAFRILLSAFRSPHFTGTRTTQWVVVQNSMRIEFAHTHLYTNREHSFELKLASLYDREQSFYSRHQLWHLLSLTFCECRQPLDLLECSTNATISSTASKFPNRLQATDILPKIKQINTI